MTNAINKVLAVVLAIGSIVFLALVMAYTSGGINWQSEMRADDLDAYTFATSEGENPQIKVTGPDPATLKTDQPIVTVPANQAAEAVIKARRNLQTQQQNELNAITEELPAVEAQIAAIKAAQAEDTAALARRFDDLDGTWVVQGEGDNKARIKDKPGMVDNIARAVVDMSLELSKKLINTTAARTMAENRRKDVFRLTNELEVVRTDRARLIELRRVLADEYVRLQITNESLKQRVDQLPNTGN